MMEIKIKLDGGHMPSKKHASDFCYDLVATSCEEVAPNVYKYDLGVSFQLENHESEYIHAHDILFGIGIRPRSSIWKTGMVLANSIGTVDEDYTGHVSAVFYHVFPNMPKYEVGDRVCQMYAEIQPDIKFKVVDTLDKTERGDGGYGSTGK